MLNFILPVKINQKWSALIFVIVETIVSGFGLVSAQENNTVLNNTIYQNDIKTVLLYKKGWELSDPVINLNGDEILELSFDELGDQPQNYYMTIMHCNSQWNLSEISDNEYIDGYPEVQINDFFYSFNTTYDYIHYTIDIPNEEMSPKLSGNYILRVFRDYDRENKVLDRRFYIVEDRVDIDATVKRPGNVEFRNKGQEIDFAILYQGFQIPDPYADIKVTLMQNGRTDNTITGLKPLFTGSNELDYNYDYENIFLGGNEFRYFDIKSMRYQAEYVASIKFEKPYYHVYLTPGEDRAFKPYYFINDLNGKYYVDVQEGRDKHIEADYVYVHFSLPVDVPLAEEDVYVFGALTDWNTDDKSKMTYNFETQSYELTLLLKQGYYNYMYAVVKRGESVADLSFFEGNHYETENDYSIYIYYTDFTLRYQKLVGFKRVNTLTNTNE